LGFAFVLNCVVLWSQNLFAVAASNPLPAAFGRRQGSKVLLTENEEPDSQYSERFRVALQQVKKSSDEGLGDTLSRHLKERDAAKNSKSQCRLQDTKFGDQRLASAYEIIKSVDAPSGDNIALPGSPDRLLFDTAYDVLKHKPPSDQSLMGWHTKLEWWKSLGDIFTMGTKVEENEDFLNKALAGHWRKDRATILQIGDLCTLIKAWRKYDLTQDMVVILGMNENWGALSKEFYINGLVRTVKWGDAMRGHANHGCPLTEVTAFLDAPNVQCLLVNNHQAFAHPKLISVPTGHKVKSAKHLAGRLKDIYSRYPKKQRLLMINHSCDKHRFDITEILERTLKGRYANSYGLLTTDQFYKALASSKYITAPSGFGWDCYRIWEAYSFGTIPIIERTPNRGWDDTAMDKLPVLWVDAFDDLTVEMMEKNYESLRDGHYDFKRITREYWYDFVFNAAHKNLRLPLQNNTQDFRSYSDELESANDAMPEPIISYESTSMDYIVSGWSKRSKNRNFV